jgi:hypothetical protein
VLFKIRLYGDCGVVVAMNWGDRRCDSVGSKMLALFLAFLGAALCHSSSYSVSSSNAIVNLIVLNAIKVAKLCRICRGPPWSAS